MVQNIQSLLTEGEEILRKGRIHWVAFVPSAIYTFVAFLVATFFHPLVGGVILFVALYPIYNAFIYYFMTDLVLTNKKVLKREGFLSRDWIRMEFGKIENAYLEQPIVGRYLGYSTVVVSGVGQGSIEVSQTIDGDGFVKALEEQLAHNKVAVKVD